MMYTKHVNCKNCGKIVTISDDRPVLSDAVCDGCKGGKTTYAINVNFSIKKGGYTTNHVDSGRVMALSAVQAINTFLDDLVNNVDGTINDIQVFCAPEQINT